MAIMELLWSWLKKGVEGEREEEKDSQNETKTFVFLLRHNQYIPRFSK
jgi:hypothetical protein